MVDNSGKLKITDFGAAMEHANRKAASNQNTPAYASPQQARNK
jgi:serine/threonine protein kinase